MRPGITFALSFVLLMGAYESIAQHRAQFRLDVNVSNLKVPAKIILTIREVNEWKEFICESRDGKFSISGDLKEPSFAWIVLKYANELDRSLRAGNVSQLFLSDIRSTIDVTDSLKSSKVKGGVLQEELDELLKASENCSLGNCPEQEKVEIVKTFVEKHPSSFVSLYAIQNLSMDGSFDMKVDQAEPIFKLLTPTLQRTLTAQELVKDFAVAKKTSIGSLAPDFVQKDTADHNVGLNSFRGRYVLVDFWASWCGPCRKEHPALVATYDEFQHKGFTILGVSLDSKKDNWIKAIKKDKLTWTHVSDLKYWGNNVALAYGVKTVPQNFLIDPAGKIVGRNIHAADLRAILQTLIH